MLPPPKYRPIRKVNKRSKNNFIILSHIANFSHLNYPIDPELRGYVPYYTTQKLREYYKYTMNKPYPFHFHVNKMLNDWEVMTFTSLALKSDMLSKAVQYGYIDFYYKDSIVIAIQDDYSIRTPDTRMYEVLGSNLISPLKEIFRIRNFFDNIVFIDEIFDIEKYNKDRQENNVNNRYPYEFRPMRYFDRVTFNLEATRFF